MRWDEERYGREYDLDTFMIFCADDFNMGAMENKGLNIFNSKLLLANPETATDADYSNIEGVIAHEYFHNWTGNRVTCRDWFQLSLKEGLTVFRDQEYSSDVGSRAVERIEAVDFLRAQQFAEDAGPTAHPVRPDSYAEINNFYTATVYEKGAEVIRMQRALLGEQGFRRGMDLYFERHDGQAVTCDDFVQAMQDASGIDLAQFRLWYSQAGTPTLAVKGDYDAAAQTFMLEVAQSCPPTPGQPGKRALHIPLAVGLVGRDGNDLPLHLDGERQGARDSATTRGAARAAAARVVSLRRRPRAAGAVAAARILGAGQGRVRLQRSGTGAARRARFRSGVPLGRRTADIFAGDPGRCRPRHARRGVRLAPGPGRGRQGAARRPDQRSGAARARAQAAAAQHPRRSADADRYRRSAPRADADDGGAGARACRRLRECLRRTPQRPARIRPIPRKSRDGR